MVKKCACFVLGTHSGSFTSQSVAVCTYGIALHVHMMWKSTYCLCNSHGGSSGNIKVSAVVSKSKCKVVPGHVMKACRGSEGIFVLVLNLGASWQ